VRKIFDNKIFKFIYTVIKVLIFTILICYVAFIAVQRLTGNKSVFGYRLFTVATSSMSGVYDVNDVIAVKDCDVDNLEVGDDIAYIGSRGGLENKLISHRIIKIEESDGTRFFITKGVMNDVEDPTITSDQILGEIIGTVPIITQINHVIHTQVGFFCLIFCPLVVVIVLEILQTLTEMKVEKNELVLVDKKNNKKLLDEVDNNNDNGNDVKKEVTTAENVDNIVINNNDMSEDNKKVNINDKFIMQEYDNSDGNLEDDVSKEINVVDVKDEKEDLI